MDLIDRLPMTNKINSVEKLNSYRWQTKLIQLHNLIIGSLFLYLYVVTHQGRKCHDFNHMHSNQSHIIYYYYLPIYSNMMLFQMLWKLIVKTIFLKSPIWMNTEERYFFSVIFWVLDLCIKHLEKNYMLIKSIFFFQFRQRQTIYVVVLNNNI